MAANPLHDPLAGLAAAAEPALARLRDELATYRPQAGEYPLAGLVRDLERALAAARVALGEGG